jgi:hypothetical protein
MSMPDITSEQTAASPLEGQQPGSNQPPEPVSQVAALPTGEARAARVELTRAFLEKNKIFFETIAATLLGLMAIILSIAQIVVANRQNYLTGLQADIAIQQTLPQFVIAARQIIDSESKRATEDKIYVDNKGGIVQNLNCNAAVFLEIETVRSNKPIKKEIVINGYYSGMGFTNTGTGTVLVMEGYRNNERMSQLEKEVNSIGVDNNFIKMDLKRYLRLTYQGFRFDARTSFQSRYYFVPLIYGGRELSDKEGNEIFSKYDTAIKNGNHIEFDDLNAKSILALVEQ